MFSQASCAPNADVDRAERWLFRMKALEAIGGERIRLAIRGLH